ncbi:MAG: hypothetical protein HKN82_03450 [Akkermansiaceae bacterium]|nr:hypothetical protein [Akkermansiaceae bacterium]NNM30826.1 hypothetical protein [Akkermansiaceae bacterium]
MRNCPLVIVFALVSPAVAQGTPGEAAAPAEVATAAGSETITPSHVYQQVAMVRAEVELIRLEMGKPKVEPPLVRVVGAAPREVYFQALTLFRKADRLAFENAGDRVTEPAIPAGPIEPAQVLAVVEAALQRLGSAKKSLNVAEQPDASPIEPGIEPTQVLNGIVAANREVNHLLDLQFAPADVYQQVSVAIACAARLLDSPGKLSTPPAPPPLERHKRPPDVFRSLVACFNDIRQIGEHSGIPMLVLEVDDLRIDRVEPSDVYDVASLVVSELAHLHGLRPNAAPPRRAHNPGRKVPTDVYQRLGVLRGQLEALKQKAEGNPGWLKD